MRSRRALAGALLLAAVGLIALPAAAPHPVAATGPAPACRLANFMTVPRDYDSWSTTLVDWMLRVERSYKPPDLVPVSEAGIPGGGYLRAVTIDDTRDMGQAAAAAGAPIGIWSPYRSYRYQTQIFNDYVAFDGYRDAITYSMRPGHSEHQLGLGVDFMSAGGGSPLPGDWGRTPAGRWMRENAWKYGWVNSYPLGDNGELFNERTCFHYEPWHYRYLGREIARKVHRSGLTIREYLWKHYVMVDPTTGEPISTPTPTPSATPSPSLAPSPSAQPSAIASGSQSTAASTAPDAGELGIRLPGIDQPLVLGGLLLAVVIGLIALIAWRRQVPP